MDGKDQELIASAEKGALEVLLHNSKGPFFNLPRTAGWGYPEPYTRDLSISALGIAVSKNSILIEAMQRVLETLAKNQSEKGQIPSLVHDKDNLGASDTTACFLMAVGIFRKVLHDPTYLQEAVERAVRWLEYQCPTRRFLIAQQPTSDWRDEQWVLGYGLYVNTLSYLALKVLEKEEKASHLGHAINCPTFASDTSHQSPHEGLLLENKPYYALWSYKVYSSDRFDLLGNSLAVLSGLASQSKAEAMVDWITREWEMMKKNKSLAVEITPNFFPFIYPEDADWVPRYREFNQPGDYHNGGIWPFISGFYIAALVAAKLYGQAERELLALTHLVAKSKEEKLRFGFNEWYKAQTGEPMGQDWQTWSASNYLYAARCVREKRSFFFDSWHP